MPRENIRSIRNQAEKQRRDKLNGYINELAANVPFVTQAKKRQDKTSVLRLAAAYIRIKKLPINPQQQLTSNGASVLTDFLDSIPGFVLISNCRGKILFVSSGVEKQLGHQDNEVIGHSLDHFLHPSDIENVSKIINRALRDEILQGQRRSSELNFICRLKEKNQSRTEVTYRQMRVTGHISTDFTEDSSNILDSIKSEYSPEKPNTSNKSNFVSKTTSQSLYHDESEFYRNGSFLTPSNHQRLAHVANDIIFLGHVEEMHCNPETQVKLNEVGVDEYISRHSLDGTLLYADHRISSILGFLPKEVAGKSAYDYILPEDYLIALFAHKLMLASSNGTGFVVHRLTSVDNSVIFLQTAGCLKFNKNGLIDHFACVSRMLKESDGERELEYFVNRFTPHIQNKSPLELYESMQMDISPYSSPAFVELVTSPDAKHPPNWFKSEQKRLLPARFERYARDQHNTILKQRNQTRCLNSSSQSQIISSPVQEPNKEQILRVAIANNILENVDSEEVAKQNQMALQKSIKNLNEKTEILMNNVKSQNPVKNGTRKRASTASQDMELQKKAKNSNPNNTFIRSYISADKSLKKSTKNGQNIFKSDDSQENGLPKSKSISGIESLPESKYKIAHGQADYSHMLGATVFTYDHVDNANVVSIYTPPAALEAQQRGRLIVNLPNSNNVPWFHSNNSSWTVPPNPLNSYGNTPNSPYLDLLSEQSGNISTKGVFTVGSSASQHNMYTPTGEKHTIPNLGLDGMQQTNNALGNAGTSLNFHLHHHCLKKPDSELDQFSSDSRSDFLFEYSESTSNFAENEPCVSEEENSVGIVDYLSEIEPNAIFSSLISENDPASSDSRTTTLNNSETGSYRTVSTFDSNSSRNNDNSYLNSGQNSNNTNYSSNTCFQYSIGQQANNNFISDFLNKDYESAFHNKVISRNNFNQHFNTHGQSDQTILTLGGQSNLYTYETSLNYNSHYIMEMDPFPGKTVDAVFSLNQPENSYDFTNIMNSVLYSSETQYSSKIDSGTISQSDSDLNAIPISGKRANNSSTTYSTSPNSEEFS